MKSILITGGIGFIGQNLVKFFQKKYKIFIIDNYSSSGVNKNYLFDHKNVKIIKKDISKFDELSKVLNKLDINYVIHAAAHFANENSILNPEKDLKTNILGTLNLLKYFKKKKIKKFIYLSSSCVYGEISIAKENLLLDPFETPYAISKYAAEKYIKFFRNYYKLNTTIVRVFNTYGPGEICHKFRNVIPRFIENSLKGKKLTITGSGNEIRDFTYVEDLVKILSLIINTKKVPNIINSCTGKKTKIMLLAKKIISLTKSKSKIELKSHRNWDKINNRMGSTLRIKKFLNMKKFTNLDHGLIKTINWYKEQIN